MITEQPDQEPEDEEVPPDPTVTSDLFREWRSPRFGSTNPERMNNPVWEWLIKSKLNAFAATERFHGPDAMDAGPGWCFDRFGQSSTQLADGRVVFIGGEHEDHYDPDFHIYNDVVIIYPGGETDILGYPCEVFPPTDFQSATLVGDRIVLIGNLGYPEDRRPGITPVMVLDLETFAIAPVRTSGTPPGWIHGHEATLTGDETSIVLRHGKLDRGDEGGSLVENIDDWKLHLMDWRWERLTDRRWQRWEVIRNDRKHNHLWHIQQAIWYRNSGWIKIFQERIEELEQELGICPDLDLADRLFCPPVTYEEVPKVEEEYNVFRIKIEGAVVRYVVDTYSIQMTVEGDLVQTTVGVLASDLVDKMSALENASVDLKKLLTAGALSCRDELPKERRPFAPE